MRAPPLLAAHARHGICQVGPLFQELDVPTDSPEMPNVPHFAEGGYIKRPFKDHERFFVPFIPGRMVSVPQLRCAAIETFRTAQ